MVRAARAVATVKVSGRPHPVPSRAPSQPCCSSVVACSVRVSRLLWSSVDGVAAVTGPDLVGDVPEQLRRPDGPLLAGRLPRRYGRRHRSPPDVGGHPDGPPDPANVVTTVSYSINGRAIGRGGRGGRAGATYADDAATRR